MADKYKRYRARRKAAAKQFFDDAKAVVNVINHNSSNLTLSDAESRAIGRLEQRIKEGKDCGV